MSQLFKRLGRTAVAPEQLRRPILVLYTRPPHFLLICQSINGNCQWQQRKIQYGKVRHKLNTQDDRVVLKGRQKRDFVGEVLQGTYSEELRTFSPGQFDQKVSEALQFY